ncbi:sugar phosphate isomerase/epimerase family protein [Luteimicrobium sp. NPDC057192]|uniref:sugar phosphate isomerase/epimerase family protein n=1 Tax=Luteimicrobium sp. NPDC057192 TaxID=3346042 RepID=UPI00363F38EA
MTTIGVQTMMLRDEFAERGIVETFRRVRDIGYRAAEISAVEMSAANVAALARVRDELGVEIASISGGLTAPDGAPSLSTHLDTFVADARTLGARMIRIGMLPAAAMASTARVEEFADRCQEVAEALREHDIALYYHNHHVDFAKYDGRFLLDVVAERSPLVGFEIDVHWVQRGGLDPVTTLRRYGAGGRVAMVHLKDYRIGHLDPAVYASLDAGDQAPWQQGLRDVVQFAEVGEGNLDFPAIVETSKEIGAAYLLVEQDEFYGRTALECLQTSYDNLVALGYGELFTPAGA